MKRRSPNAFTLVELMVSIVILTLLFGLLVSLMNSSLATLVNGRSHMDADSQARLVFDRLGQDFSQMVMRSDVDYYMKGLGASAQTGNDQIAFYCQTQGYYSGTSGTPPLFPPTITQRNPFSLVGYEVVSGTASGAPFCQLERLSKGFGWEPSGSSWTGVAYLPVTLVNGANPRWPNLFSGPDPDFQILSDQVFRFEYIYMLKDGTYSLQPIMAAAGVQNNLTQTGPPGATSDESQGYSVGSRWYDTTTGKGYICLNSTIGSAVWGSVGFKDVDAVVVALGVLDTSSRAIVTNYTKLAGLFPDAVAGQDILPSWTAVLNSPTFAQSASIPHKAAAAVRIYQRYFQLSINTP